MKRLVLIISTLVCCTGMAWAGVVLNDVSEFVETKDVNASTVAWGDINGDARQDLFIGDAGTQGSKLFLNKESGFVDADVTYDVSDIINVHSAQLVDFDSDGLLDIFCLTTDGYGAHLYRQTPGNRFQEVSLLPEALDPDLIVSAAWADFDGDGRLDILLSNTPAEPYVTLLKQESSVFVELRGTMLPANLRKSGAICVVDYDNDRDLDIFLGTGSRTGAQLYANENGEYVAVGESCGIPPKCSWTGAAWFDYNNDQFMDLVCPGPAEYSFLLESVPSQNERRFKNASGTPGFAKNFAQGRYVHTTDMNGDGWMDIIVLYETSETPRLLLNQSGASWTSMPIVPMGHLPQPITAQACAVADFDNDGNVDIALACGIDGVKLYHNTTPNDHEWINICLLNPGTMTPVLDASMVMQFQFSKHLATTSAATAAPGGDSRTITLHSEAVDKSEDHSLYVSWPNGIESVYTMSELTLNAVNKLYMPSPQPENEVVLVPDRPDVRLTNAPNPFNPTTTVNFVLPENSNVKLAVYDLLGREVVVLADAPYQAGSHALTFNAADLPSGLYFARLTTASVTRMHRMLLVK